MEKNAPMTSVHQGSSGGHTKASSIPVTTADRSPMDWGFFSSLRYSHSQNRQATMETTTEISALKPKL